MTFVKIRNGFAMTLRQVFYYFPVEKLKSSLESLRKYKWNETWVMMQIFLRSLHLVIEDIVYNNVTFMIDKHTSFYCRAVEGDEFKRKYKYGSFQDIDYLETGYMAHQLAIKYRGRITNCYVNKRYRDVITERTNKGFRYY